MASAHRVPGRGDPLTRTAALDGIASTSRRAVLARQEKSHGNWHCVSDNWRGRLLLGILALGDAASCAARSRPASITGKVTDAERRRAARGRPRRAHRHATGSRPPAAKASYTVPRGGAGHLPAPRAPGGLPARHRVASPWRPARRPRWTSRMDAAPVQLDEIVTTATGEQRKLEMANAVSTIDAAKIAETGAHHRVRQPDLRPRGRRPGAQEQRDDRHRHPDPDPRLEQHLALQRAAVLPRRRAARERLARPRTLDISGSRGRRQRRPSRINDINPDDIE